MRSRRRVRAGVVPGHGVHAKETPAKTAGVVAYSLPAAPGVCGLQDYDDGEKENDQNVHVLRLLLIIQRHDRVLDQDLRLEQRAALGIQPMFNRVGLSRPVAGLLQL